MSNFNFVKTSFDNSDQLNQPSTNQKMIARKIRFIKRLKNCIETKRGNKFNYLQQLSYIGQDWLKKSENILFESHVRTTSLLKTTRSNVNKLENESASSSMTQSRIELDTSVDPVFF